MRTSIDAAGRVEIPEAVRIALGLVPGTPVDITLQGSGARLEPTGRAAQLVEVDGVLVASSDRVVTDEDVRGLIDAGRDVTSRHPEPEDISRE
jgi:bifunctional DNA-binding transcriptional regulator/antitoxin component of YhaV-PrlF toxin-antitoxin module